MADVTLALNGAAQTVVLAAATVRRVVLPVGTRYLEMSCAADFFEQIDTTQQIADGAATTAADARRIPAGLYTLRVDGSGSGMTWLDRVRYALFYAASATPSLYVRAKS